MAVVRSPRVRSSTLRTMSFVLFIISLLFVLVQFQLFRGWKEEGS